MDWFRSWHGAPTDTTFLVIARRAQVPPGMVSAVYWALLDYASQNNPRGSIAGFDTEAYAEWAGWEESQIIAIIAAFQTKGKITEGGEIVAWAERQPKREDDSAPRVAAHRQRERELRKQQQALQENVTRGNAMKQNVTIEERRGEEKREEEEEPPPTFQDDMTRQYEAVLGMVPTASYLEMIDYMRKLNERKATDWWGMALRETTGARKPGWQYMKAILESWLAAGTPSVTVKATNGHDPTNRKSNVPGLTPAELAAADARQEAYERQMAEDLARAGLLK